MYATIDRNNKLLTCQLKQKELSIFVLQTETRRTHKDFGVIANKGLLLLALRII